MIAYRPEIDGLRAIAVMSVIFGHAGFELFSGGFVGVDIFFVISGYLISSIVISEVNGGNFSYRNFYERRARRLLPALLVVLIFSSVPSYFFMLPDELENYGQSLIATIGFSNNILLWITSGYWELDSEFKPLLHMWSLGVEEQFYLIFPAIIIIAIKKYNGNRAVPIFLLVFILSFLMTAILDEQHPDLTFYLLPTRVWELTAGILIALLQSRPILVSAFTSNCLSILGGWLIVMSIIMFDHGNSGVDLLVPVLGASLVIYFSNKSSAVTKTLSSSIFVKIGLVSYSAYLIHMPLFAYLRLSSEAPPELSEFGLLIAITLILAWLSYRFIETPFRSRAISIDTFVATVLVITCVILSYAILLVATKGFSESYFGESRYGESEAWVQHVDRIYEFESFSHKNHTAKVLVLGNSYGRDFANMLLDGGKGEAIDLVYREEYYDCDLSKMDVMSPDLSKLLIQADVIVLGSGSANQSCLDSALENIEKMNKLIFYLGYKNFGYNLNFLKFRTFIEREDSISQTQRLRSEIAQNEMLKEIVPNGNFISLMDLVSDGNYVQLLDESGRLISVDRTHLTKPGSEYMGRLFYKSDHRLAKFLVNH